MFKLTGKAKEDFSKELDIPLEKYLKSISNQELLIKQMLFFDNQPTIDFQYILKKSLKNYMMGLFGHFVECIEKANIEYNKEIIENSPVKLPDCIVGGNVPAHGINKFINPKLDDKFSLNLYRFLTYKKRHLTNVFQDPKTGIYYIGLRDEKGIWIGAILMNVFCLGGTAKTFSYATSVTIQWKEVTTWFWSKYLEVGKEIYNLPEWKVIH